jgi:hypothetical protein
VKAIAKLFSLNTPACDGSIIPTRVFEEYLSSPMYEETMEDHTALGAITHYNRKPHSDEKGVIGKDDRNLMITPQGEKGGCFTHYISKMWIEGEWAMGEITFLNEDVMDTEARENIRRVKGLIENGINLNGSAVIIAYWNSQGGNDYAAKIQKISGWDFTANASFAGSKIVKIIERDEEKTFSETAITGVAKVKTFSNVADMVDASVPKSSKINGQFTKLIAKEFSCCIELKEEKEVVTEQQKEFTAATVKERLREGKMSPRLRFRRTIISYKQVIKQLGGPGKMKEEDEKVLKALFITDLLDIVKTIAPEIEKGKQINTLLGASTLGKNVRVAAQKLQLPFRMSMTEIKKNGYPSKMRYQKIQDAYLEFVNSICSEVFGTSSTLPENLSEEDENDLN